MQQLPIILDLCQRGKIDQVNHVVIAWGHRFPRKAYRGNRTASSNSARVVWVGPGTSRVTRTVSSGIYGTRLRIGPGIN